MIAKEAVVLNNCPCCGSNEIKVETDYPPGSWQAFCEGCLDYDSFVSFGMSYGEACREWNLWTLAE